MIWLLPRRVYEGNKGSSGESGELEGCRATRGTEFLRTRKGIVVDFLPLFFFFLSFFLSLFSPSVDKELIATSSPPPRRIGQNEIHVPSSADPFSPSRSLCSFTFVRNSSLLSLSLSLFSLSFFLSLFERLAFSPSLSYVRETEHVSQGERRESDKWLPEEVLPKEAVQRRWKNQFAREILRSRGKRNPRMKGKPSWGKVHDNGRNDRLGHTSITFPRS